MNRSEFVFPSGRLYRNHRPVLLFVHRDSGKFVEVRHLSIDPRIFTGHSGLCPFTNSRLRRVIQRSWVVYLWLLEWAPICTSHDTVVDTPPRAASFCSSAWFSLLCRRLWCDNPVALRTLRCPGGFNCHSLSPLRNRLLCCH